MKEYGYFRFPFLVPCPKAYRKINYYDGDPRFRMQFKQQVSQVCFKAVDVKEVEE